MARGWRLIASTWYWAGVTNISQTEDYLFGIYNTDARERDEFVYTAVYSIPVCAAGNDRGDVPASQPVEHQILVGTEWVSSTTVRDPDGGANGYDTIGSDRTAKNIITVGAVNDIASGYTEPADVVVSDFSCFGPTDDGRIKPDIVANGVELTVPTAAADNDWTDASGTSFSAPSIAGSLGLLQELHEDLHGTNQPLWASTYKGLVLHTADEAGDNDGPDYRFGWGLMNTFTAACLIEDNAQYNTKPYIKEVTLSDGDHILFNVTADTSQPLRVTMCWTDPPGILPPAQLDPTNLVLVNDMDLRIIDPSGTTNFPWTLDPANPTNAATTGDNFRDNVEQILIENTTTGLYSVVVMHKGSLSNDVQDVSLLLSGNIATNIDLALTELTQPSSCSRVTWTSSVGSIHTVMTSTNLLDTNGWSDLSDDLSISKELTTWMDEANSNAIGRVRFYRVKEIK